MTVLVRDAPFQATKREAVRVRIGGMNDQRLGAASAPAEHQRVNDALGELEVQCVGARKTQPVRRRLVMPLERIERDRGVLQTVRIERITGENLIRGGEDFGCIRSRGAKRPRETYVREHAWRVRRDRFPGELERSLRLAITQCVLAASLGYELRTRRGNRACELI